MPVAFLFRPSSRDATAAPEAVEIGFDDRDVRVGRGDACELRLPHESVSDVHAVVRSRNGAWTIADDGSRNGTWVNGSRLTAKAERALRDADLVRVGAVWFEVRVDRPAPSGGVDDTGHSTRDIALEIVARCLEVQVPTAVVVEGPDLGARLELVDDGRAYLIGRSSRCDLDLIDIDVSREHVRLVRRGLDVLIADVGAKNGVMVGDQRIPAGQAVSWPPRAAVRVGGTVFALELPPTFDDVTAAVMRRHAKLPLDPVKDADDSSLAVKTEESPPPEFDHDDFSENEKLEAKNDERVSAAPPVTTDPGTAAPIAKPLEASPVPGKHSQGDTGRWADFILIGFLVLVGLIAVAGGIWFFAA